MKTDYEKAAEMAEAFKPLSDMKPKERAPSPIDCINVEMATVMFGKPVWGFFKAHCQIQTYRRKRSHTTGEWRECEEAEFVANFEASQKMEIDRFMGRGYVGSFWKYEKRIKTPGWPQVFRDFLIAYDPAQ